MGNKGKHTPGPWIVGQNGHVYAERFYIHSPFTDLDGNHHPDFMKGLVALPYFCGEAPEPEDVDLVHKANATLISCAPDLLEILEELASECLDEDGNACRPFASTAKRALEICRKAKGGPK